MNRTDDQRADDYLKYRGKCKEFCEAAIAKDSALALVRGHYFDFQWGEQPHWWTVRTDGTIYDPTKDQFPSRDLVNTLRSVGWSLVLNAARKYLKTKLRFMAIMRFVLVSVTIDL